MQFEFIKDLDDYFSVAEKYNNALAADVSTDDSKLSILSHYDEILDLDDGVMGYVEIPSINVRLPIYHGESEDVLTKGAAHLEHTSFPIGGENTHACISAHCGYPTQKFFDDIDELENGDEICKASARFSAPSNAEDGVAQMIEKYALSEE